MLVHTEFSHSTILYMEENDVRNDKMSNWLASHLRSLGRKDTWIYCIIQDS